MRRGVGLDLDVSTGRMLSLAATTMLLYTLCAVVGWPRLGEQANAAFVVDTDGRLHGTDILKFLLLLHFQVSLKISLIYINALPLWQWSMTSDSVHRYYVNTL